MAKVQGELRRIAASYLRRERGGHTLQPTAVVNEADLYAALVAGRLAGAGLDVFEEEPPGRSPLFELDSVVLTPHAAGGDLRSRDEMALSAAQAIISLSRGEWPAEKVVNPGVREKFRWGS